MGVQAETRHKEILDQLHKNGKVFVNDVAEKLNVTQVTVRRDLVYLQKKGLLKKIYGGAVLAQLDVKASVRFRQKKRFEAKKIVGKLAARLINDNDIIYLEAGSTCNEIIPHLENRNNLTIIVNSLFLMRRLHEMNKHKIIIVGGQYRPQRMDLIGPAAELAISQLSGFKAFTSADDIAVDAGISGADIVTVGFSKLLLKKAAQVIFVGDHTKFDNPALYKIANIDRLDYIVTNSIPSPQWHSAAKKHNIKLIYPDAKTTKSA